MLVAILLSSTMVQVKADDDNKIPVWLKKDVKWWSEGQVTDSELL